jgi:Ca-activated chloride channel family protein
MIRHAFAQPMMLLWLALLPALALLSLRARARRRRALALLGATLEGQGNRWLRRLRGLCLLLGLTGLVLGMAGPRWGRDWSQSTAPGRDLVVVLDCSRSMRAEAPSRLERARTALLDLTTTLARRGGNRVGLVTFAGRAKLVCPLTHDLDHFREAVQSIDLTIPDPDLEPIAGDRSGTRIGRALALAVVAHDERSEGARDILLLSDGDDPARDAEYRAGATLARKAGIPVHCVGFGDPDTEHPIPLNGGWLRVDGELVQTRLEEAPLRDIATRTGGTLELPGSRSFPLGEHYLGLIADRPQREDSADALPEYRQRYPLLLLPAFVLLALTLLIPDRRRAVPLLSPRLP